MTMNKSIVKSLFSHNWILQYDFFNEIFETQTNIFPILNCNNKTASHCKKFTTNSLMLLPFLIQSLFMQ